MPHPSAELEELKEQLEMYEAEVLVHREVLNNPEATVLQKKHSRLRAEYLATRVLPKVRDAIQSNQSYLEWEQRTNNPAPRST